MLLVCLQDEVVSGKRRDVDDVVADCLRRDALSKKKRRFKTVLSQRDYQYRRAFQAFMWSMCPQYAITLNFNYANDVQGIVGQKYRNQSPPKDWMVNCDAMLQSGLVSRRFHRLPRGMRLSWVAFPEFTTTGNLHYHILLWLPDHHRLSKMGLTKRRLQARVRAIITSILKKLFEKASVKVQAIWSKRGSNYATKCVTRRSEIEWAYWRKEAPRDAGLNTSIQSFRKHKHDDTSSFSPRLRRPIKSITGIPAATGTAESEGQVGRRQTVRIDDSTAPVGAADHSAAGNSAWRFSLRNNPYRSVLADIVAMARGWFTMPITDG